MSYVGTKKITGAYVGASKVTKIYVGTDVVYSSGRLPSAYQEVEWIQSNGTNCILQTGWTPDMLNDGNMEVYIYENTFFNSGYAIGTTNSSSTNQRMFIYQYQIWYPKTTTSYGNINIPTTQSGNFVTIKADWSYNNHTIKAYRNDVLQDTRTDFNNDSISINQNMALFGQNYGTNKRGMANARLGWFKGYNGTTLALHLIPCYRKSDSVGGMYDLVSKTFITTTAGGTYTVGSNV